MEKKYSISKYASIINRFSMQFYDHELKDQLIGGGQFFFLARICEQPGISAQELAKEGHFDKATATRAMQRLEELQYIRRDTDQKDRRINRFYPTEKTQPIVDKIYAGVEKWNGILKKGMTQQEAEITEYIMEKLAKNAYEYISKSIEEDLK